MLRRRILSLARVCAIIGAFAPNIATAQELVRFDHLTVDAGLSHNEITAVMQDSLGFLWVGTVDGLNRFDGYDFSVFQFDPTDLTSISGNYITSLLAADDGALWVGTREGLNRYDPETVTFFAYRAEPGNASALAFDQVSALHEDPAGRIWIGHSDPDDASVGGVSRLDPRTGEVRWFSLMSSSEALPVHAFGETADGILWIGTADGLGRYDPAGNALTMIRHDPDDDAGLGGRDIRKIIVDTEGSLWLGFWGEGLDCYDPLSGEVIHHRPGPEGALLSSGYISAIAQSRDGLFWIGTANPSGRNEASLHRYDFKSFTPFGHDPNKITSVGEGTVTAILEDYTHMLWVGTDPGGLNRFDQVSRPIPHFYPIPGESSTLASASVSAFLEEGKDAMWVGTAAGLDRFDRFNESFEHHRSRPGSPTSLSDDRITALAPWRGDTMWVGTENGLNRFNRATGVADRYLSIPDSALEEVDAGITTLLSDVSRDQLWVGTAHGLDRMDVRTGAITHIHGVTGSDAANGDNKVVALFIAEALPGTLWVGTENGLKGVDLETNEIVRYDADARNPAALSHRHVTSLATLPADSNALWVGTLVGGLNRLDLTSREFQRFTRRNSGLPTNTVYGIQSDDEGFLWLATNRGLVSFNPADTGQAREYGIDVGVQSRQFNVGASYKTSRGEIAFGGSNGFNIFSPFDFRESPYEPKVVITGFRVDGSEQETAPEAVLLTEEIELAHSQNHVAFDFVGLHFSRPIANQYRVLLERRAEDSTAWREIGTQRTTTYSNLSPGRYTFRVQAANSDGVWGDAAAVRVRITPPWWQTWWFRIFAIVSVIWLAFRAYRRRIERIAKRNQELEGLVLERTEELEQKTEALESKNDQLEATLGQLRTAQTQLVQAEKLASLGRVTAGVAHEIKNPLNFINNFAQLSEELTEELRTELASSADRSAGEVLGDVEVILGDLALNAAKIAEHGRRADGIVKSMLLHARGTSGDPEPTSLHTLLDETIGLVVHSSGAGGDGVPINVEREYDERIGDITIVRQAVGRVVLNLLENAVYAMREHGASEAGYVPTVTLQTLEDGEDVRIFVRDNGPGIPHDVRARLFEPFFTTKPTGSGTGLGLSLAHDIIHSHQGEITVESTLGAGTTFTIVLPRKPTTVASVE